LTDGLELDAALDPTDHALETTSLVPPDLEDERCAAFPTGRLVDDRLRNRWVLHDRRVRDGPAGLHEVESRGHAACRAPSPNGQNDQRRHPVTDSHCPGCRCGDDQPAPPRAAAGLLN
jgi:hypothetical protein